MILASNATADKTENGVVSSGGGGGKESASQRAQTRDGCPTAYMKIGDGHRGPIRKAWGSIQPNIFSTQGGPAPIFLFAFFTPQ